MATTGTKQAWARGGLVFAATLMLIIGVYQFFVGLAAIIQDNFFVVGPNYAYEFDTTAWGWIHLGIGVLVAITGFFLFTGASWARVVGVGLLALSAVANFFFLPYYPLWALLLIGLDVFAIWAIATARSRDEFAPTAMASGAGMGTPGAGGMAAGTYAGDASQTGERWPAENVAGGRHWAPQDVKEGAGQTAEQAQQQGQHAAQSAGQTGQQMGQQGQQAGRDVPRGD